MRIGDVGTFLRTIRHLQASQMIWRARYAMERVGLAASPPSPPETLNAWEDQTGPGCGLPRVPVFHRPGPVGPEAVVMLGRGEFRHLNRTVQVGRESPEWGLGRVDSDRLWINTLHYHYWAYDLAEQASEDFGGPARQLLEHYLSDWITRCGQEAPGALHLAWNSYVIATRLTWWIRAWLLLRERGVEMSAAFRDKFLAGAWRQAGYLNTHIEWDLRANHVLRDAAGLAWAGRFFGHDAARPWLDTAARIAVSQAREQVLPDGGHFERSPMYHLHAMEDMLSLALLLPDREAAAAAAAAWQKMAGFLVWVSHPDGGIPLLNDSMLHEACEPEAMLSLHSTIGAPSVPKPGSPGKLFPDTGIVVWRLRPWTVFFDVGRVGPDYQPGHAHADTLSLECSHNGARFIVDPGVYCYDNDDRRRYDRSTAAHNTVCIDGRDSSEVWHIFRVGRRARPRAVAAEFGSGRMNASASHDGYDHLPGRPRHERGLSISDQGVLSLRDTVRGKGAHRVCGGFLLAPAWKVRAVAGGWEASRDADSIRIMIEGPPGLKLFEERRPYHPGYGLEQDTLRLCWRADSPLPFEVRTVMARE
jgi:uncharacterized heparinase superfamily protein